MDLTGLSDVPLSNQAQESKSVCAVHAAFCCLYRTALTKDARIQAGDAKLIAQAIPDACPLSEAALTGDSATSRGPGYPSGIHSSHSTSFPAAVAHIKAFPSGFHTRATGVAGML